MTYGKTEVMAAIEAAVASNPDGLNPMKQGKTCLNRAEDPEAPTPRCIASQVHFDLTGRELAGPNMATINTSLIFTYEFYREPSPFDSDAKFLLRMAQARFDTDSLNDVPWSEALDLFKKAEGL